MQSGRCRPAGAAQGWELSSGIGGVTVATALRQKPAVARGKQGRSSHGRGRSRRRVQRRACPQVTW